ncbi:MAG: alpha-N-arabinofuranosidase, partial [Chloroflexi bacterium]|nr:alpha-N-arabinofuranosidase [Chloroflexota bacterium]
GAATEYTVDQWYELLHRGIQMEKLVVQQRAILDGYDPERKIGLIVDEWGTWHPPTAGHHPRHLWQQNTLRDALVAASTLDIFNRHADKVVMANIAQTINVLQAMILTDGDRMLTTPTYHVYDMYQSHQGGLSVRAMFDTEEIELPADKARRALPMLSGSASVKDGVLTLTVVNMSADQAVEASLLLRGGQARGEGPCLLLADEDIHAHNTMEAPDRLAPRPVRCALLGSQGQHTFPPASVTALHIRV